MSVNKSHAHGLKQWINFYLPTDKNIDSDWVLKLIPERLYKLSSNSVQGSRLITNKLKQHYHIAVPDKVDLKPEQQWLMMERTQQKQLAQTLGVGVCADFIRRTIRKDYTQQIITAVGEELYRKVLKQPALATEGVSFAEFEHSLEVNQGGIFLMAIGVALLELTLDKDNPFFKLRMNFAFPLSCWNSKPRQLRLEQQTLVDLIIDITESL